MWPAIAMACLVAAVALHFWWRRRYQHLLTAQIQAQHDQLDHPTQPAYEDQLKSARQEFVANVSHELRTPLSLIQGYTETLLDGAINDPQVSARFLQTISRNTARLTFLIEDLLTISELESGKVTLEIQESPLRDVVYRVLEDVRPRSDAKKIRILVEFPADLMVRADHQRLHQVLLNLIDNAIKYSHAEGHVWIGAQSIADAVQIWVRDDGPGIPSDARNRVFERFYRVDKARSREHGGTGLGLAIVKHIVQAHGGTVWLESEMGRGSTFHFTLPQS